jgi:hypothetical protein
MIEVDIRFAALILALAYAIGVITGLLKKGKS